jgi:hypothetical protein
MKEALSSSETSVLTRVARRNIPEDIILEGLLFLKLEWPSSPDMDLQWMNLKTGYDYNPSSHSGACKAHMCAYHEAIYYQPQGRGFDFG